MYFAKVFRHWHRQHRWQSLRERKQTQHCNCPSFSPSSSINPSKAWWSCWAEKKKKKWSRWNSWSKVMKRRKLLKKSSRGTCWNHFLLSPLPHQKRLFPNCLHEIDVSPKCPHDVLKAQVYGIAAIYCMYICDLYIKKSEIFSPPSKPILAPLGAILSLWWMHTLE